MENTTKLWEVTTTFFSPPIFLACSSQCHEMITEARTSKVEVESHRFAFQWSTREIFSEQDLCQASWCLEVPSSLRALTV